MRRRKRQPREEMLRGSASLLYWERMWKTGLVRGLIRVRENRAEERFHWTVWGAINHCVADASLCFCSLVLAVLCWCCKGIGRSTLPEMHLLLLRCSNLWYWTVLSLLLLNIAVTVGNGDADSHVPALPFVKLLATGLQTVGEAQGNHWQRCHIWLESRFLKKLFKPWYNVLFGFGQSTDVHMMWMWCVTFENTSVSSGFHHVSEETPCCPGVIQLPWLATNAMKETKRDERESLFADPSILNIWCINGAWI